MATRSCCAAWMLAVSVLTGVAFGQAGIADYNRRVRVPDIIIVVTDGDANALRLLGSTHYWGAPNSSGTPRDISGAVEVLLDGTVIGGPGSSGGGTCGSNLITYGTGTPFPIGPGEPWFNCFQFCTGCTGSDVNVCVPQSPSPDPLCICMQQCMSRLAGGGGGGSGGLIGELSLVARWSFEVPAGAHPDSSIVVRVHPIENGLPELDTSDDVYSATVADLMACGRSDLGRQGGLRGHDNRLDNNDFIAFIDAFFDGDAAADLGRQGGVIGRDDLLDNNDFIVFIELFFRGC